MTGSPRPRSQFRSTRWSVVLRAQGGAVAEAGHAVRELCEIYWYPLYAFLRRRGAAEGDALAQVQGFLADFLERPGIDAAAPERGRFRAYLLGALRHHVANAERKERALKRGGDAAAISLDDAEERYGREPQTTETAEAVFERRWALAVLDRALERLAEEYERAGKTRVFAKLRPALAAGTTPYAALAAEIGTTEGAVKVAVHRMRRRMRELVRDEIGETVASAGEVDEELAHLFRALAGPETPQIPL